MFPIITVDPATYDSYEQMGSKDKFWFTDPNLGYCLFKEARSGTGEDWAEKVAEQLCILLGIPHARYEFAVHSGNRGVVTPRIVSRDDGKLIHGNELLTELIADYDDIIKLRKYRTPKHTLEAIFRALTDTQAGLPDANTIPTGITTALDLFVGYILLDAWIGNTDRHHENWALIEQIRLPKNRYLAPTFDHGSCLGRNESDIARSKRLNTKDKGYSVGAYASKARSAIYHPDNDQRPMSTIEAFEYAMRLNQEAGHVWLKQLYSIEDNRIDLCFEQIPNERISPISKRFARAILDHNREVLLRLGEVS